MSTLTTTAPGFGIGGSLARGISDARASSPFLTRASAAFLAAALVTAGLGLVDARTVNGANVWAKPSKFYLSLSVHCATLAWALTLLAPSDRRSRAVRSAVGIFVTVGALEMAYITLQAARAEPSHFNTSTLLYRTLYSVMGAGAVSMVIASGFVGFRVLRWPAADARPVLARAAGIGLLAAAVLGGGFGAYLGAQRGHWVGGVPSDTGGLPVSGWSTTGGDLRVAHFCGLHAVQVIAVVGWLARSLPVRRGTWVVCFAALAWSALTLAVFVQAVLGRPVFPA